MSSSRRTYDTEMLTIRQVFAYNSNNSVVPAGRVLASSGNGATFWATPSSIGGRSAWNEIVADNTSVVADLSYNKLFLSSAEGIGLSVDASSKIVRIFNKGFTTFDISGGNTIRGYSNSIVSPTVKFVGKSGIQIAGNPATNTLTFTGIPTAISTGIYGYHQMNVISNASTITTEAINNSNYGTLTADSTSTILRVIGAGDIRLTTNAASNAYFIGISTFTSKGYLDISGAAFGAYSAATSTVSTLFTDSKQLQSTTAFLANFTSNVSVGIQNQIAFDQQNVLLFYTPKADFQTFSNATNGSLATLSNTTIPSTVAGLGSLGYFSTTTNTLQISSQYLLVDSKFVSTPGLFIQNSNLGLGGTPANGWQLDLTTDNARKLTTSTWATGSDRRVKKNIEGADYTGCLSTFKEIPLHTFDWNIPPGYPQPQESKTLGFIAQEIESFLPNAVLTSDTYGIPDFRSLQPDQLFKLHFGATKKLVERVETLESTVTGLQKILNSV